MSQIMVNGFCFVPKSTSIPNYKKRKISAVRDFPPECGPRTLQIDARDSVQPKLEIDDTVTRELPQSKEFEIAKGPDEAFIDSSFWDPASPGAFNSHILSKNLNRKFPQRRKISAVRDFPPLRELPQRDDSSPLEKSESSNHQGAGPVVSNLKLEELDSGAETGKEIVVYDPEKGAEIGKEIVMYDPEKGDAKILDVDEVGKEIVVHSESSKSRGQDLIVYENSLDGLKAAPISRGFVSDMDDEYSRTEYPAEHNVGNVIVYALMAAPNYQRRQSKEANLSSRSDFHKNKALKYGSHSGVKKSQGKKLLEERRVLNAGLKRKNLSSNHIEATPLRSSYPCATEIEENKLDSWEQDDAYDELSAGHRTREIDLPPMVPNNVNMQKGLNDCDRVSYNKVRETLRLFQAVYRKLTHEEEASLRRGGTARRRIDLDTATILKEKGKYVNTGQVVGSLPGVDVGLEFQFRVELAIVGLHRPFQAGIDYIKKGGTVIATSIVASGGYADDMDSADVLHYSGSGGNPSKGDKKGEDQKLERGNLALKNSISAKNPVRVIRGHEHKISGGSEKTRTVKTYTYDGLYIVTKYWQEPGPNGNLVYMFRLERIPGQPELAWNLIKKSKKSKVRHGVCMSDISQGKELMPICAVNTVDDQKPPSFKYITKMLYPDWCQLRPLQGCDCVGGCSDSASCLCAVRNGGEIPFNNNGSIVEAKPLVYECGPSCKCPPSCSNRVSQFGIRFQLEIFKTESRGWGVRSLNSIPSGTFICEYLGELLEDKQAEQRIGCDEYLFDIGSYFSDQNHLDKFPNNKPHPQIGPSEVVDDVGFTIDAERYGNVGRFINHSCSPNLYAQNILYDHEDWRMPHIMLFAVENVPPLQELTYHYNYNIGEVRDANGNVKTKHCFCGSTDCTGRLY